MKNTSTLFLKLVIICIGLLVIALCIFALPAGIISTRVNDYRPILIGMYVPAIPFFWALHQGLQLLKLVDHDKAFSLEAVASLRHIKYCAAIVCGLYVAGMPYIYYIADKDDAPGVVALGLVIVGASFIIATAAALFQRLFQNAVDIKTENDLTV